MRRSGSTLASTALRSSRKMPTSINGAFFSERLHGLSGFDEGIARLTTSKAYFETDTMCCSRSSVITKQRLLLYRERNP